MLYPLKRCERTVIGVVRICLLFHCDSAYLEASPDGTILASDNHGVIKSFNFESLRLSYQLSPHEENIRSMVSSTDRKRFHYIRGIIAMSESHQC